MTVKYISLHMSEQEKSEIKQAPRPLRRNPAQMKLPPKRMDVKTPKYIITKFNPVYVKYDKFETEICAICKSSFSSPCAQCEANDIASPCPIENGFCGHAYHLHCIRKWVEHHPTCPTCNAKWEPVD